MDWINWKRSKSETIHLHRILMIVDVIDGNHSIYWIVNHWNRYKLVNIVSVIMLENLNWRIYHNYNPFELGLLEESHSISIGAHLWFEVLIWYRIFEWLDLPNLQTITLGDRAFCESLSTIIESIEWMNEWNDLNRSSFITIHYTRWTCTSWSWVWFLLFIDNAK